MTRPDDPTPDAAQAMRLRVAGDLKLALKARDGAEISALRSLLAALDNAGAVATTARNAPVYGRSGDVPRRALSAGEVEGLVAGEIAEREASIADYERGGHHEAADRLRAEARVLARYGPDDS
ncbi:MAG TPA: GatB/YqeY domain-containing protein [Caulobacteraceae bacterium]|nr:GatB/YqeY domain-containing protein [Caulobacteraceae bacterium]